MKKLLIVGVNTRPLSCSAQKLNYQVYSASYFCTTDFDCYYQEKHILEQKPYHSCGFFADSFAPHNLEKLCVDWIDEVDKIITYTGISPEKFPSSKILGNKDIKNVENKFKLYKKLKKDFKVPLTFLLSDTEEAYEIAQQNPQKNFIIKPVQGSGGYNVFKLADLSSNQTAFNNDQFIMQEFVSGENVSASVLSTGKKAISILTSQQISGEECPGLNGGFIYCGNLSPYPREDSGIKSIAEKAIEKLGLIGSNGVDMIISEEDIYIIEVNPRLQGTFECAESSLGINMIEAHIKACEGELIQPTQPLQYTLKKIFYAHEQCQIPNINVPGVHDLPLMNTIIEKGEPVVTILGSGKNPIEAINRVNTSIKQVREKLTPIS